LAKDFVELKRNETFELLYSPFDDIIYGSLEGKNELALQNSLCHMFKFKLIVSKEKWNNYLKKNLRLTKFSGNKLVIFR